MSKAYSEKLRDPQWQRKRLEIMSRDEFQCRNCGSDTKTLHVHHLDYIKGAEPWEYGDEFLITLCEECHDEITEYRPRVENTMIEEFRLFAKLLYDQNNVSIVFTRYRNLAEIFNLLATLNKYQDDVEWALVELLEQARKRFNEEKGSFPVLPDDSGQSESE